NRSCDRICIRHNDRARRHRLASLGILPPVPKARKTQHAAIRGADEIEMLAVWHFHPLVIAARRDDAAVALERIAEHRLTGDALDARVEARRQLLQRLFHQYGMRPQRIGTSSAGPPLAVLTTSTASVGATL